MTDNNDDIKLPDNIMGTMGEIISIWANANNSRDGDYLDADGFLMCGKCQTRKQYIPEKGAITFKVPIMCECEKAYEYGKREFFKREEFRMRIDSMRKDGITSPDFDKYNFGMDDMRDKMASKVCRRYTEKWDEMRSKNIGLMLYGDVGTGKSFLASCIISAMLEKQILACATTFPRLLNLIDAHKDDKQWIIDRLQKYSLLVIDDLGVERETSYASEQIFSIMDARLRSGKPMIITTNLSPDDLRSPAAIKEKRIYSRLNEICPVQIEVEGNDRRKENSIKRLNEATKILMGL